MLKNKFTSAPILAQPDTTKPFSVKTDASAFAHGAVLSQDSKDEKSHPCTYLSHLFTDTEHNYNIYDCELLAIIRALETWQHYLEGSLHQIDIVSDHQNLLYFKDTHKLSRRQVCWMLFMSRFDYIICHAAGKTMTRADALSRRPDHGEGKDDNEDQILLPQDVFISALRTRIQMPDSAIQDELIVEANKFDKLLKPSTNKHQSLSTKDLMAGV
ncbi:hypothetical protein EWM64_g6113 [Hericium alpestre]|uniref:Reverse transcriptase RNase H-like domain-containing protein n=1 Tax=Hericium alpestre TaxID=135208 RepID=A0A4Y9ZVJ4_9AGAM|nr:hypothetical protein EWM64_g6113 [Hericium alpestre]